MNLKTVFLLALLLAAFAGCGINSVTPEELQAVKPGDILFFRYRKPTGDKSWMYAQKVVRVTPDSVYVHSGTVEGTSVQMPELREFDESTEMSMAKSELVQFADEQGEEKRVVIRIN